MRLFQRSHLVVFSAALVFSGFLKADAQTEQRIGVGTQPAAIHRVNNDLHVFCSGSDKNYNRAFDPGDVAASWWVLDATTLEVRSSLTFENSLLAPPPLRPAFSSNSVYLYINGMINKYSLFTQQLTTENVIQVPAYAGHVYAMSVTELTVGDVLNIVTRPNFTGPGLVFSYFAGLAEIGEPDTVGINPQQIWVSEDFNTGLLLSEGIAGQNNSTLVIGETVDTMTTETTLNIGDTGNFFLVRGDSAFVVMTGSHSVQVVNLEQKAIVKTISTGTSEFNGPRECTINGDTLFVTTYNNDIRALSISSGALLKTLQTSGKVDPIIMTEGKIVAGISLKADYSADTALAVFGLPPVLSVGNEDMTVLPAEVFPNPVQDQSLLSSQFPENIAAVSIEIFTSTGISVGKFLKETSHGKVNFSIDPAALMLAQGQYIARISAGENLSFIPFSVVK